MTNEERARIQQLARDAAAEFSYEDRLKGKRENVRNVDRYPTPVVRGTQKMRRTRNL